MIAVERIGQGDAMQFAVTVREGRGETRHRVTMRRATYMELTGGRVSAEECIRAAFAFLLDREPKESILATFDITVISKYFPTFARDLATYLP